MKTPKSVDNRPHQRLIRKSELSQDDAQTIAVEGLGFLAADGRRLERFLALSGLNPGTLRATAHASGFLSGVLDHIASEETLLVGFSAALGRDPEDIARAREILGSPHLDLGA